MNSIVTYNTKEPDEPIIMKHSVLLENHDQRIKALEQDVCEQSNALDLMDKKIDDVYKDLSDKIVVGNRDLNDRLNAIDKWLIGVLVTIIVGFIFLYFK